MGENLKKIKKKLRLKGNKKEDPLCFFEKGNLDAFSNLLY